MATDHEGYMKSWSIPELSSCKQQSVSEGQDVPISEILDHGSISFGRYATESLAWEKWSVFSHNRCQEELEKFKAPGLVAQKKAYFEEYYKKIRAMKALQAEQQEIAQPDSCQDANSSNKQGESDVNIMVSQEKKPSNVSHIPNSDNNMISNLSSSLGGTVDESEQATEKGESYRNTRNDKSSLGDKMNLSFPISVKKASPLRTSSIHSSKSTQGSSTVSNMVNNNVNQLKKQASVQQAKGRVASIRNKTNLDSSRRTTNNVKQSVKPNPSPTLHRKSINKDDKSRLTSKNTDPKPASNNNKKITEVPTNTTSKSLAEKIPTRSSVQVQSAKLVSSSSTIRPSQVKTRTTSRALVDKSPTGLSVCSPSAKSISEKTIVAGSLRNTALAKRSADLSMQKKSNQKIGGESGQRSYVKEGMQKEGKDKLTAALGREPKATLSARLKKDSNAALANEPKALSSRLRKDSNANAALAREPKTALSGRLRKDSNAALGRELTAASSVGRKTDSKHALWTGSDVPQAQNAKLTQKIVPCRSPDLVHGQREPTQSSPRPIWR